MGLWPSACEPCLHVPGGPCLGCVEQLLEVGRQGSHARTQNRDPARSARAGQPRYKGPAETLAEIRLKSGLRARPDPVGVVGKLPQTLPHNPGRSIRPKSFFGSGITVPVPNLPVRKGGCGSRANLPQNGTFYAGMVVPRPPHRIFRAGILGRGAGKDALACGRLGHRDLGVVGLGFRISRVARFHVEMGPLGEGPGENGTKTSQVWLLAYFLKETLGKSV